MSEQSPPPVEIVELDESVASVSQATDSSHLHDWLRTIALVAIAVAFVWIGISAAGIRAADEQQICFTELQTAMFTPSGPQTQGEIGDRFVERAENCGLPLLAESIRQNYASD